MMIAQNVRNVCQSPSENGRFWAVNLTADGHTDIGIRLKGLPSIDISSEATFSRGEWEGVQQVLRQHQAADNKDFRQCAKQLTPLFIKKFGPAGPTTKRQSNDKVEEKKADSSREANSDRKVSQETTGNDSSIYNAGRDIIIGR